MDKTQRSLPALFSRLAGILFLAGVAGWTVWLIAEIHQSDTLSMADGEKAAAILAEGLPARASIYRYQAYADRALSLPTPDLSLSREASLRSIAINPDYVADWNRLAYLEYMQNGLSPTAEAALRRSYTLSPYGDKSMMRWRLQFGATMWDDLPADLRRHTMAQINGTTLVKHLGRDVIQTLPADLKAYADMAYSGARARLDAPGRCTPANVSHRDTEVLEALLNEAGDAAK